MCLFEDAFLEKTHLCLFVGAFLEDVFVLKHSTLCDNTAASISPRQLPSTVIGVWLLVFVHLCTGVLGLDNTAAPSPRGQ